MRDSVYRINLDIHTAGAQVQLTAKRGDVARRIYMTLYEDGKPWAHALDGMTRAVLTVVTPEDILISNDCDIRSDGTVVYDFTALTVKDLGVDECELTVYDSEGNVLTSPRFTILVDDTVFETGQIAGAAWQDAIDRAKAEIRETTDAIEEDVNDLKTQTVRFPSVSDMAAAAGDLKPGMQAVTLGRWTPRDGGARTYMIADTDVTRSGDGPVHNPLAIELAEGLYAIPIIDDHVTALDIGLRRGRIREDQVPKGVDASAYADKHERDDDAIAATNSAKLQAYLDAIPQVGTPAALSDGAQLYGGAHLNRIFFPVGQWYFRDPIVVRNPTSFIGTRSSNVLDEGRRSPDFPSSCIAFLSTEYICTTSFDQASSSCPFVGDGCSVVEQPDASKLGDENYDRTRVEDGAFTPESAYIDHALFYVASNKVSFRGLDFRAIYKNNLAFYWQVHPNNSASSAQGPKAYGWKPEGNAPWNHYTVHRRVKGVCAIIVRKPLMRDGKIRCSLVEEQSGPGSSTQPTQAAVRYVSDTGAETPTYCKIDCCGFSGFSGFAVIAGRLSSLNDSTFYMNYVAYKASTDNFLHDSWFGNGFVGLVTNGHTLLNTSGMFIDCMAGFGVMSYLTHMTFGKRTVKYVRPYDATAGYYPTGVKGDGQESSVIKNGIKEDYYFCEHEAPTSGSRLTGRYDIFVLDCVMGAYFAYQVDWGAKIGGIVKRCGSLYNSDVRIVDKNDFETLTAYKKASEFYGGLETVYATYGTPTPAKWDGDHWILSYAAGYADATQTITDYLNADMGGTANVPKAYDYLLKYKGGAEPPADYRWDGNQWTESVYSPDTRQKLSAFLNIAKAYSKVLLYVDWIKAETDGIRLEASKESYYASMSGSETYIDVNQGEEIIERLVDEKAYELAEFDALDRYNHTHDPDLSIDEARAAGVLEVVITEQNIKDAEQYVIDNWGDEYAAEIKKILLANRSGNFLRLVGASAISICTARGLVINGQIQANSWPRHAAPDGLPVRWQKENMMPLFGINMLYGEDCDISGFTRVPRTTKNGKSGNQTGMVMTPAIVQYYAKSLKIEAPVHPSEDAAFSLVTNNTAADSAAKQRLVINLSHDASGKLTGTVYGYVKLTENTTVRPAEDKTGESTVSDTVLSNLQLLHFRHFLRFYTGTRQNVFSFPLYSASGGGAPVGLLIFNFRTHNVTLCGYQTYTGEIYPFIF